MKRLLSILFFSAAMTFAENWHNFTDSEGRSITGLILSKTDSEVTIRRKKDNREFTLPIDSLSPADREMIKKWAPAARSSLPPESIDKSLPRKLFPRSRAAIREARAEILARKGPDWAQPRVVKALNDLNFYRYLSGLGHEVTLDEETSEEVVEMLREWNALNGLSPDEALRERLKKTIYYRPSEIEKKVHGCMSAYGSSQLASRTSRQRLLDHRLHMVGMGQADPSDTSKKPASGIYLHLLDGPRPGSFWTYPGFGFYPADLVRTDAWTVYFDRNIGQIDPPTVRLFKLDALPKKKLRLRDLENGKVKGEEVNVSSVHVYWYSVIFTPKTGAQNKPIGGEGIYAVFVEGDVEAEYVVALFN